jgi:pimeloyl-ACP methyl ester carboxylesterase
VTAQGREEFIRRLDRRLRDPWLERERNALEVSDLRHREPSQYRQRSFELSIVPYLSDPERAKDVKRFVVSSRVREAVWRSLTQYDLTTELCGLAVPSLVIHGRFDPIPLSSSERTADLLAARLEVFEKSGHLPFLEEFDRFVAVLDGFLPREQP